MTVQTLSKPVTAGAAFALLAAGALFASTAQASRDGVTVVTLTQTGCQFVELENGMDHGYMPKKAEDCVAINKKNGGQRLAKAGAMTLKPGKYVFRVTNKNVPYSLGFWLRSEGYRPGNVVDKLTKTSVSGGGLTTGKTRDYEVTLKAGESYVYSCPLNPTPNYRITVAN